MLGELPLARCSWVALCVLLLYGLVRGLPKTMLEAAMTYQSNLELYADSVPLFVGGYTVAGNAIAQDGMAAFEVEQECLCECNATTTGIFCRGANDDNAFYLVLSRDEQDGRWRGQQVSVGVQPAYQALMDFSYVPGGEHTAVGYRLSPSSMLQGQTLFRAQQSAVGCAQGVGAKQCEAVCANVGLPWAQIRDRCRFDSGLR